jgi:hypothetical protein
MSGASRSAERIARRDVDHMARVMIASPSIAHVSHSGLASAVYWAVFAVRAAPASEPQSATPILTPTWRLVEATAEAAPRSPDTHPTRPAHPVRAADCSQQVCRLHGSSSDIADCGCDD